MALVTFKDLPDTTTPLNAANLNGNFNELKTTKKDVYPEIKWLDDCSTWELVATTVRDNNDKALHGKIGDYDSNNLKTLLGNPFPHANYTRVTFELMYGGTQFTAVNTYVRMTAFDPYSSTVFYRYLMYDATGYNVTNWEEATDLKPTVLYEGKLLGGQSITLSGVKSNLKIYSRQNSAQSTIYTMEVASRVTTKTYASGISFAHDEEKECYISESCYNFSNNQFEHTRTGFFNYNTGVYSSRNNIDAYYIYKIETYD